MIETKHLFDSCNIFVAYICIQIKWNRILSHISGITLQIYWNQRSLYLLKVLCCFFNNVNWDLFCGEWNSSFLKIHVKSYPTRSHQESYGDYNFIDRTLVKRLFSFKVSVTSWWDKLAVWSKYKRKSYAVKWLCLVVSFTYKNVKKWKVI